MTKGAINVTHTNDTCDTTCKFTFNYKNSQTQVTNNGDHIKMTYESGQDVEFSGTKYEVQEIRIYSRSLNKYKNRFFSGEIIIHHVSGGGDNLLVCIPIVVNNNISSSHTLFRSIVKHFPINNSQGAVSLNEHNFNLNHIVPRGGFYYYVGKTPYEPYDPNYNIILFDPAIAPNINRDDYTILRRIINDISSDDKIKEINHDTYRYNASGTLNEEFINDDKIYIKCNPVDQEGNLLEEIDPQSKGGGMNIFKLDFDIQADNKQLWAIGGSMIGAIVLILGIYAFQRYVRRGN